jgi:multiple sugar transport system permease protein
MTVTAQAVGGVQSTTVARAAGGTRASQLAEALAAYALTGPAVILLLGLFLLPVLAVLCVSLTDWELGAGTLRFVGLENFRQVLTDPVFHSSLINTLVYVLIVVPGSVILGLSIALLIECGTSLRSFYRAIHFLPFMASLAAMAIAWDVLLHPTIGLVSQVLAALGRPGVNLLRDEATVLPALAVIGIWQNLGFVMVLFLAGLKAIPQDLYDAAEIDGADSWLDRLATVTLPMLGPTSMFVVIVVALHAFQTFDTVRILTQGGPNHASDMLLYTLYRESFEFLRTGYGAAVTVIFLAIIMTLTVLRARIMDRKVHYS